MIATKQDKRHDFLWIVQMFMQRDPDVIGWRGFVGDAVAASYRIPQSMTARDAALDFWGFFSGEEGLAGGDKKCPHWMVALDDPRYS